MLTTIDGLVPKIRTTELANIQLAGLIAGKKQELDNLPDVIRLREEIRELEKTLSDNEKEINSLRDEGKNMLLSAGLKEFTALDGTTVSLRFTPGALVVNEGAKIPEHFYKEKVSLDLDKKALKEAIANNEFEETPEVYIKKDCSLVIKN